MNLEIGSGSGLVRGAGNDPLAGVLGGKHQFRLRVYAALLVLDCIAILLAFAVGNVVRFGDALAPAGVNIVTVLLPLFVAIAATNREIYGVRFFKRWRDTARRAVAALLAAVTAVLFVSFYMKASAAIPRETFTIGVVLSVLALPALRLVMYRYAMRRMDYRPLSQLLICDHAEPPPGHDATTIDAITANLPIDVNDPRALDRVGRLLKHADRVVVACSEDRRTTWAMVLKGANIQGEILSPELSALGMLGADLFAAQPTLVVSLGPLDTRSRALKRGLDLALATAALLALAPLMLLTALAVRLGDGGPVLFTQTRLGRGNRMFTMFKFRSMRSEASDSEGAQSTRRGDARVTAVGRIIRATSIDELPQLLNVLRGDMSIVGPRPHALGSLAGDKLFWEVDSRYWHRHAAKPGITGLAQVRGFRGATHLQSDLADRLQADLDYLNGWTLWRDISILFATFRVVLHRNAY